MTWRRAPQVACVLAYFLAAPCRVQAVFSAFEFEGGFADTGGAGNSVAAPLPPNADGDAACGAGALRLEPTLVYRMRDPPNAVPVGGAAWALGFSVKLVALGTRGLVHIGGDAPLRGVGIVVTDTGGLAIQDGATNPSVGSLSLMPGVWAHFILRYDAGKLDVYSGTTQIFSYDVSLSLLVTSPSGGLIFGALSTTDGGASSQGTYILDEVRLATGWPGFPALQRGCLPTPAPPTPAPPTPAPPTPAPQTPAPQTPAPATFAPPATTAPETPAPATTAAATNAPPPATPVPETPAAPTLAPATLAPASPAPMTPAAQGPAPAPSGGNETGVGGAPNATYARSGLLMADRESLELLQTIAAFAGLASGGGGAGHGGRIVIVRNWGCETGGVEPLEMERAGWWWGASPQPDVAWHPTRAALGEAHQRWVVGMTVVSLLLVVLAAVVVYGVAVGTKYAKVVELRDTLGRMKAPGVVYIPFLFVYQAVAFAGARLVMDPDHVNEAVLGGCVVAAAAAAPAALYFFVLRKAAAKAMVIPDPLLHPEQPLIVALREVLSEDVDIVPYSGLKRDLYTFILGEAIWIDKEDGAFTDKFGIIFERYRRQCVWVAAFELAATLVISLAAAWVGDSEDTCNMRSLLITIVFATWFVVSAALRPCIAALNNIISTWLLGLCTLASCSMTVAIWARVDTLSLFYPTAYHALYGACVVVVIKAVCDVVALGVDLLTQRRSFPRQIGRMLAQERRAAEAEVEEEEREARVHAATLRLRREALEKDKAKWAREMNEAVRRLPKRPAAAAALDVELVLIDNSTDSEPPARGPARGSPQYPVLLGGTGKARRPSGWGRSGGYLGGGRPGKAKKEKKKRRTSHRYPPLAAASQATGASPAPTSSTEGVGSPPPSLSPSVMTRSGTPTRPAQMGGVAEYGIPDSDVQGPLGDIDLLSAGRCLSMSYSTTRRVARSRRGSLRRSNSPSPEPLDSLAGSQLSVRRDSLSHSFISDGGAPSSASHRVPAGTVAGVQGREDIPPVRSSPSPARHWRHGPPSNVNPLSSFSGMPRRMGSRQLSGVSEDLPPLGLRRSSIL